MSAPKRRKSALTTLDLHRLDRACEPVWNAVGRTYLVGTAQNGGPYRDVDVRTILDDEEFDRLFGEGQGEVERHDDAPLGKGRSLWSLLCVSVGQMLAAETGLPIDYQIQRRTQANETYPDGTRNPVGRGMRVYAGGGDATWFGGPTGAETRFTLAGVAEDGTPLVSVDGQPHADVPTGADQS